MKGYLEYLDTLNFSYITDDQPKMVPKLKEAKVRLVLYSVFYEIVFSPNQILDLLPLREIFRESDQLFKLPFDFHIDRDIYRQHNPFEKQLIKMLRRSGTQAILFSSIPYGTEKALEWGQFIETAGNISDSDLLTEAIKDDFYPDIVEWVKKLDQDNDRKIMIKPFAVEYKYGELFTDYRNSVLSKDEYQGLPEPQTRSQAIQLIDKIFPGKMKSKLAIPNFISNIQYGIGTDSRLILENTPLFTFNDRDNYTDNYARVTINIKELLDIIPSAKTTIDSTEWSKIIEALNTSKEEIKVGWYYINTKRDERLAKKHFKKGLITFLKNIGVEKVTLGDYIDLKLNVLLPSPENPSWGFNLSLKESIDFFTKLIKRGFKGIDKFIIIKPN
ncbi:MAG: hypothetical protein J7K40_10320 [candidate division Zixibacteria bacterium]|nr:hypothetical protein [candidate division Zixibacteria bacterium]